jgi:N-acetylglucosaminyl-diphospho-decaprenol L-rhamnosyltransferase
MMRTAVVTIAHGRHDHWRMQRAALARSRTPVDDHVLVAIDDRGYADGARSRSRS